MRTCMGQRVQLSYVGIGTFAVADIAAFMTLSKNVGDKTALAAKLAKRTCLGDMYATFWRHMQLRRMLKQTGHVEMKEKLMMKNEF